MNDEDTIAEHESLLRDTTHEAQRAFTRRVFAVDILRGIGVALTLLVTDGATLFNHQLDSVPWNGFHLADFVPALFLFVLGYSMSLRFSRFWLLESGRYERPHGALASQACARGLFFIFVGLILGGTSRRSLTDVPETRFYFDLSSLRIPGVMQRLGLVYIVTSLITLLPERAPSTFRFGAVLSPSTNAFAVHADIILRRYQSYLCILACVVIHACLLYGAQPSKVNTEDHTCLSRGKTTPQCNIARDFDIRVFGKGHILATPPYIRLPECQPITNHTNVTAFETQELPWFCSQPFDPWGLLGTLPAIAICFVGFHCCECMLACPMYVNTIAATTTAGSSLIALQYKVWSQCCALLCVLGAVLHFSDACPINRSLFSPAYTLISSGLVSVLFVLVCFVVEHQEQHTSGTFGLFVRRALKPFSCLGRNAFIVFVFGCCGVLDSMLECVYWRERRHNNIVYLFRDRWLIGHVGHNGGLLLFVLVKLAFYMVVTWLMHKHSKFVTF